MSSSTRSRSRVFTVEQANARLPLVRVIARDLVTLSREVVERQQRLEHLTSGREMEAGDPYEDELNHVHRELEKDRRRLRDFAAELEQLGVELKSAVEGIVDFPSRLEGRKVFLCWKLGDAEVLHWHEVGEACANRQPLTAATVLGTPGDGGHPELKA